MSCLIQRIINEAIEAFGQVSGSSTFHQRFFGLVGSVADLRAEDVNFDPRLVASSIDPTAYSDHIDPSDPAPVTFIEVAKSKTITVGMFVLRKDAALPLHDHPHMHGIIKFIYGRALIRSYNIVERQKLRCARKSLWSGASPSLFQDSPDDGEMIIGRQVQDKTVDASSKPCVLTPDDGNLHEIVAVQGPAAFLDILAPPYDHLRDSRTCHYYREVPLPKSYLLQRQDGNADNLRCLIEIFQPPEYWCNVAPYSGPNISLPNQG